MAPERFAVLLDEVLRKVPIVGPAYHRIDRAFPRPGLIRRFRLQPPVFVYQMGKVGSTSIYESLRDQYSGEVLHSHCFGTKNDEAAVHKLYRLHRRERLPVKIISPIRDPISRNVSAMFQNFELITGQKFRNYTGTVEELMEPFLQRTYHILPHIWFDENLLTNFGIDVYATPFPDSGFARYQKGPVEVLVLRHDLPNPIKQKLIGDFTGQPDFSLRSTNVSSTKAYAETYAAFKRNKLPSHYVNRMLDSKYARHFYGNQLEELRQYWTRADSARR